MHCIDIRAVAIRQRFLLELEGGRDRTVVLGNVVAIILLEFIHEQNSIDEFIKTWVNAYRLSISGVLLLN
jgi:hypothetical protein